MKGKCNKFDHFPFLFAVLLYNKIEYVRIKVSGRQKGITMISNRILQTTVDGLKAISRVDLCIVDADKNVAAKTFDNVSECLADAISFIDSPAESQAVNGFQFFKVEDDGNLEYIIMARGTSDDVYMVGKLTAFQIQNLLVAYKERFDKDNFIKNLLLDNLLRVDMYTRAEKLHIETDVKRVVYIIETKHEKDTNALETVRTLLLIKQEISLQQLTRRV